MVYKCSHYYDPSLEREIALSDPDVGIVWPDVERTLSQRDINAPRLRDVADELPFQF